MGFDGPRLGWVGEGRAAVPIRDVELGSAEAIVEQGIEVQRFGPLQATAFREEPEACGLNLIQGAAEGGAVEGGPWT